MPSCSLCGFACEWLRSAYSSEWYLHSDLEEATPGRYVFVPNGTPFYPGPHNLWSRNWITDDNPDQQPLGENRTGRHSYYNGETPSPYPRAQVVGSRSCIESGEGESTITLTAADFFQGYLRACYLPPAFPPSPPVFEPDIQSREDQLAIARIIDKHYTDPAAADVLLRAWIGPLAETLTIGNSASLIPGTLMGWGAGTGVILISGTSNFQQLAMQVIDPAFPTIHGAGFDTLLLWLAAAVSVGARASGTGVFAEPRLLIAGHSYGGATSCVLAAQRLAFGLPATIQLLTFGCPKPGDVRLKDLLIPLKSLHICNDGDPVPFVPPEIRDLPAVPFILGSLGLGIAAIELERIGGFSRPVNQVLLRADGQLANIFIQPSDQTSFAGVVSEAMHSLATTGVAAHAMSAYVARLSL
jgi:hypothetical protein